MTDALEELEGYKPSQRHTKGGLPASDRAEAVSSDYDDMELYNDDWLEVTS